MPAPVAIISSNLFSEAEPGETAHLTNIKVQVEDGVVNLWGTVTDEDDIINAPRQAETGFHGFTLPVRQVGFGYRKLDRVGISDWEPERKSKDGNVSDSLLYF